MEAQCWICPLCYDDHRKDIPCGEWVHRALTLLLNQATECRCQNYSCEKCVLLDRMKKATTTSQEGQSK